MRARKKLLVAMAAVVAASGIAPLAATTLIRTSLEELTATNRTILVGEALDAHSYWNEDHTFMFTDVRIAPREMVKGRAPKEELVITIMGGTVGDISVLILSGPQLEPERSYLLFLNNEHLPGAPGTLTVRDLSQGAFDIKAVGDELRAVSQSAHEPLLPDASGAFEPPGGREGFPLETMIEDIRRLVRGSEVNR